jgi:predicted transposase YbfD/YdcC
LSAVPALLDALPLQGRIVTGDALYMQHAFCNQVIQAGGDYLFIVKGNQPTLHGEITCLFAEPKACADTTFAQQGSQHGNRTEVRQLWASAELGGYLQTEFGWTGAQQACKIRRQVIHSGGNLQEERYALTSLSPQKAGADTLLSLVRGHWLIENRLHYVRDVTFGEDANQTRTGAAPQVMAALRNVVLNLLRAAGHQNIASALREIAWQPHAALILLGRAP